MQVAELYALFGVKVDPKGINKAHTVIDSLKTAIIGFSALQFGKHVVGMVLHATEAATHLVSMSHAIGLTIEQTQEWGHVAERSGSSLTELSVGMNMMLRNLRLYSEGRGSKVLRDRFREIGLSVEDAKSALASPDGFQHVLLRTSDALKNMGENGRTATFTTLFGVRAGRAMLADMARGSAGLEELFERRRKMGELNKAEAEQMRDLDNRVRDVKSNWDALVSKTVARLAPKLIEIALATTNWMQANGPLISGVIETAIDAVVLAFRALAFVVRGFVNMWEAAMGGSGFARAALLLIASFIAAVLIPITVTWAAATWAALAPYLAIAVAIAAAVAAGYYLMAAIVAVFSAIGRAVDAAMRFILQVVGDVIEGIIDFATTIYQGFADSFEAIKNDVVDFCSFVFDEFSKLWHDLEDLPIIGYLFKGVGAIAGGLTGIELNARPENSAVNAINRSVSSVNSAAAGANVTMGPTIVTVTSTDPKAAANAIKDADRDRLRHAQRALGGN